MTEKLSKGGRKYFREELAAARRGNNPRVIKQVENDVAARRLAAVPETPGRALSQVERILTQDNLPPQVLAEKGVERIWLKFITGNIDRYTRSTKLQAFLEKTQEQNPAGYNYLQEPVGEDRETNEPISRLLSIQDRLLTRFPLKRS